MCHMYLHVFIHVTCITCVTCFNMCVDHFTAFMTCNMCKMWYLISVATMREICIHICVWPYVDVCHLSDLSLLW